jgi:hypothetical protein
MKAIDARISLNLFAKGPDVLKLDYANEAEHQDGEAYWEQFETVAELLADYDMYCRNLTEATENRRTIAATLVLQIYAAGDLGDVLEENPDYVEVWEYHKDLIEWAADNITDIIAQSFKNAIG